ncbi:deoxycytidylate deaminase [Mycobacterium phage Boilgate]|nr:deoxycytidylate deaminase [Mycobacterium phage Boilgate]
MVKSRRVRGTGYNGSTAGQPGCQDCPRRLADVVSGETPYDTGIGRCVAVHAEANALLYCDREDLIGVTLYVTRTPCPGCEKLIRVAGCDQALECARN